MDENTEPECVLYSNETARDYEGKNLEVITVWYNRPDHVKSSIGSIINQTLSDYSILAVDDGSTDDTGSRLEDMLEVADEQDVPMRLWKKPNEGFTTSLKRAIEEKSTAEIIALHGAGDISLSERIETQIELLESEKEVIASGVGVRHVNSDGEEKIERNPPKRPTLDLHKDRIGAVPRLGTHGSSMYYREAYLQAGGYREAFVYSQDTDLFTRLIKVGDFLNTDQILYEKLVSEDTVASKEDWEKSLHQIICSAAALQSARLREEGLSDPVDDVGKGNIESLEKIAMEGGLSDRAVKRGQNMALHFLKKGEFVAAYRFLRFIGWRESAKFLILIAPTPKKLRSYIKNHIL